MASNLVNGDVSWLLWLDNVGRIRVLELVLLRDVLDSGGYYGIWDRLRDRVGEILGLDSEAILRFEAFLAHWLGITGSGAGFVPFWGEWA